ncbi:VanW family protein [Nocardioides daeguensis]|uniref:VanW family protein n=1 Tax=Nocardioides daeguensis TaxID=908359 RepID=A0ABP6VI84_9ACTN|nr:VanW family protein [Nocardioides daeguensis]MBV6729502.1 VanW family protein [Nocardioides daeguensis]MCR1771725.1 VanW family protein [Nocardioides daeguensis]
MTFWDSDTSGGAGGKSERPGGKVVVVVIVLLVLLAGGGYAAAHAVAGDKVPTGTTISGVDVGGLTRAAAIEELDRTFGPRADAPITVSVGRQGATGKVNDAEVQPGDIGLAIDLEASVDAAGAGDSWSPARQWDYFTGGGKVDAVVDVDEELLDEKLTELSEGLGTPPRDGTVTFTADGVQTTQPQAGQAVDRDKARAAITDAFLSGETSVELEVAPAQPEIDAADVAEALDSFANPAMANAVTLQFGENDVKLTPAKFAPVLSMKPENGELVPSVDAATLTELVKGATASGAPVDATVKISKKGKPKIVPAKPGVTFDSGEAAQVFLGLLTQPEGSRTAPVTAQVTDAAFTTKDAEELKIVEKVSEFSTYYPHADYRNTNIGRAAELIDGTLLKPGEEFSLNGIVGERTAENGFTEGYIISNGILKKDLGGGVSQMATTTFNAMFFAGLKDIQHKPHSFYIDRYPVGREATVAWPTVDLRFQNDTEYGVLIHAWVVPSTWSRQGKVTVQMWSTKKWDIDSSTSARYAQVPPKVRTLTTPDCEPNTGWSGFQVDVTRTFRKHGDSAVDHTEKFHTVYTPADTVKCEKPAPAPAGSPDPGE